MEEVSNRYTSRPGVRHGIDAARELLAKLPGLPELSAEAWAGRLTTEGQRVVTVMDLLCLVRTTMGLPLKPAVAHLLGELEGLQLYVLQPDDMARAVVAGDAFDDWPGPLCWDLNRPQPEPKYRGSVGALNCLRDCLAQFVVEHSAADSWVAADVSILLSDAVQRFGSAEPVQAVPAPTGQLAEPGANVLTLPSASRAGVEVVACTVRGHAANFENPPASLCNQSDAIAPEGGAWPHQRGVWWTDAERVAMFKMRHLLGMTDEAIAKVAGLDVHQHVYNQIGKKDAWKLKNGAGYPKSLKWRPAPDLLACCQLKPLQPLQAVAVALVSA